jgi:dipeptidase D
LFLGLENQIQLISIDGGSLRNAIPREAKAIISVNNSEDFTSKFEQLKSEILEEFASLEKDWLSILKKQIHQRKQFLLKIRKK